MARVGLLGNRAKGKRHRGTEGEKGTNTGHEDGETMASAEIRLTAKLDHLLYWASSPRAVERLVRRAWSNVPMAGRCLSGSLPRSSV
jgi:hypothetical protein